MRKKTSASFRSIWLGILVLTLTNLAIDQGHIIAGNITDFSTSSEITSVSSNAKVIVVNSITCANGENSIRILQKKNTFTFFQVGFGAYQLPVIANASINILQQASFITSKDIATNAPYLSSHHSI